MSYAIGIDIGGTKVAIGIVDGEGRVITRESLPTDLSISPEDMVSRIAEAIKRLMAANRLEQEHMLGIGIGAPGPLDPAGGRITCPPNLPNWRDFALVAELKKHLNLSIVMENDATAATLAEHWIGAAKGCANFVYVTISTGIGAGIFMNGKLLTGASGNAGDAGHIVIDPSQGTCVCGQKGCWEWVGSGTAIARKASEILGRPTSTQEAFASADQGHAELKKLIEQVFTYTGMGCVSLINTLDPQMIVIGGGVSQVGEPLFKAVRQYVSTLALNPTGRMTQIVPAALQQDVGLIGAAALVHVPYR
ncbi:ROK family protein [Xylanibacillus composti]|uniref:Glucokinase n=1 Tax=Xylanibacillus composti TaxID=1572762 RepID=A0A8J4H0U9_9BACL|nr:ROK family protein [Xylanibacillus composti]MDT9723859.1 ROK family protein [Xylanibacillus composti]GIQ67362.1 glucokinase [Xylanibacillus composti]